MHAQTESDARPLSRAAPVRIYSRGTAAFSPGPCQPIRIARHVPHSHRRRLSETALGSLLTL